MEGIISEKFPKMVQILCDFTLEDGISNKAKPLPGGTYTATGNNRRKEIADLIFSYSRHSGNEVSKALSRVSHHLNEKPSLVIENLTEDGNVFICTLTRKNG